MGFGIEESETFGVEALEGGLWCVGEDGEVHDGGGGEKDGSDWQWLHPGGHHECSCHRCRPLGFRGAVAVQSISFFLLLSGGHDEEDDDDNHGDDDSYDEDDGENGDHDDGDEGSAGDPTPVPSILTAVHPAKTPEL